MRIVSTATLMLIVGTAHAQYSNPEVARHVAAARAIAGEHAGMVDRLCPRPDTERAGTTPRGGPRPTPPRESWHAEPVKVFDNFYFVGEIEFSAWAVTTSDGIVVIDPIFDYSVEDEVVNGLTKLGLDPTDILYVIVSHGHYDHAGGAKLLQERFGARVLMSAADWDMLERDKPAWLPRRDIEVNRRPEAHGRRHDARDALHSGPHERHDLDVDPGTRRRRTTRGGALGRHAVQLRARRRAL